jgi:hypothetical protein
MKVMMNDVVQVWNAILTAFVSSIIAVFAVVVSILARFVFVSLKVDEDDITDSIQIDFTDSSRIDNVTLCHVMWLLIILKIAKVVY